VQEEQEKYNLFIKEGITLEGCLGENWLKIFVAFTILAGLTL
jgi:hypothetical protein